MATAAEGAACTQHSTDQFSTEIFRCFCNLAAILYAMAAPSVGDLIARLRSGKLKPAEFVSEAQKLLHSDRTELTELLLRYVNGPDKTAPARSRAKGRPNADV
jgi:hypothetical protein